MTYLNEKNIHCQLVKCGDSWQAFVCHQHCLQRPGCRLGWMVLSQLWILSSSPPDLKVKQIGIIPNMQDQI